MPGITDSDSRNTTLLHVFPCPNGQTGRDRHTRLCRDLGLRIPSRAHGRVCSQGLMARISTDQSGECPGNGVHPLEDGINVRSSSIDLFDF
jgi:hypothetical protein